MPDYRRPTGTKDTSFWGTEVIFISVCTAPSVVELPGGDKACRYPHLDSCNDCPIITESGQPKITIGSTGNHEQGP